MSPFVVPNAGHGFCGFSSLIVTVLDVPDAVAAPLDFLIGRLGLGCEVLVLLGFVTVVVEPD